MKKTDWTIKDLGIGNKMARKQIENIWFLSDYTYSSSFAIDYKGLRDVI